MKDWSFTSRSAEQTAGLGECLGRLCNASMAVLLEGDLGSGKTCFVQGVARGLDVPAGEPVNSPTYTLMNHYPGRLDVYHFDLYRLGSADELRELDFDGYLFGAGVTLVEWAGLVNHDGVQGLHVSFDYGSGEEERILRFRAIGTHGERLLSDLNRSWKEN